MADDVAITAGSGTSIATDDCTSGHAQIVKLAYSADGNRTHIPADADGLLVNLGTNNDVTLGAALPAGTNAIGKLAANSGVDIGDVDVTSVTPGTTASSLGKAEDAAHATADVGVMALAVRKATPANVSDTDGDYEPLQVSAGRLWASATIDASIPAGTNNIGDVDVLTVPAPLSTTGNGTAATALRVSLANDSTGIVALTTSSAAIGKLAANSGVDIGDVDVTTVIPGTGATNLGKAIDSIAGATDTGVAMLAIRDDALATLTPADGDWAPLRVDSQGGLVLGGDVHDATDTGNPIKLGAKAETSPAGITLVADGDRTNLYADADGLLMTKPYTAYGDILVERLSDTGGTSTASTVFGATANARNFITTIAVYNSSASAGYVDFRDGTGGTVLFTMPLPAGGGSICNFPLPLRQTTTNTAFAYDVSGALTTVYISLVGFKSKA